MVKPYVGLASFFFIALDVFSLCISYRYTLCIARGHDVRPDSTGRVHAMTGFVLCVRVG